MDSIIISAGTTITLPQNTYTKDGYTFVGWNTVANPTEDNPGISYTDQSDFTASSTTIESITLYATWAKTIDNLTYMQDFKTLSVEERSSVLQSMTEDEQYQLVDNRDSKTYYISKLKDGNVWMTQNLDLDLNNQTTLTPANTNISANWTPVNNTIALTDTSVSGWTNDYTLPYSADPGELYIYSSGTADNDTQYTSLADCQSARLDCSAHNHAGNYYSWSAAVASNDTSSITAEYDNAPDSICPAGWRLPSGPNANDENYSDMANLVQNYNDILEDTIRTGCGGACKYYDYLENGFNSIRTIPLMLVRAGSIMMHGITPFYDNSGTQGAYWSSTVASVNGAPDSEFNSFGFYPARNTSFGSKSHGHSIRCLAE